MRILFIPIFIILLLPLYFLFIGSFQDIAGIMRMPPSLIPLNPTLLNYQLIFKWPLGMWAINSFIMVASTIILSVGVSSSAGYVFAFYTFPGKRILWVAFLFGVMVPRISFLIPQYVVLSRLGLSGEMLGVILSYVFVPTSIYLARNYFETVPKSLLESARMDGASEFRILTRIVMPLSKPILAALTTFASIGALGDYIWQMLVLQDVEKQTLMVGMIRGIMHHDGEFMINPIGRSFAAAVVLFIPVFTIFLIANRYYTGALGGAIKE